MKKICLLIGLLLLWCLGSSLTPPKKSEDKCPETFNKLIEYRLFFGRNNSKGEEVVTDTLWDNFLTQTITPLFPDGLTTYEAKGQWTHPSGHLILEKSKVVLILTDSQASKSLQKIKAAYKKLFQQESILIVMNHTCATF